MPALSYDRLYDYIAIRDKWCWMDDFQFLRTGMKARVCLRSERMHNINNKDMRGTICLDHSYGNFLYVRDDQYGYYFSDLSIAALFLETMAPTWEREET